LFRNKLEGIHELMPSKGFDFGKFIKKKASNSLLKTCFKKGRSVVNICRLNILLIFCVCSKMLTDG
jgi:hypothetical protein